MKIFSYEEYLDEDAKKVENTYPANPTKGVEDQPASTNNYPVPNTCVKPAPGDKITYHVKDELEKSKMKLQSFPMLVLDHRL